MLYTDLSVYHTFPVVIQQGHLGICFAEDIMCITIRHLLRIGFSVHYNDGNTIQITSCVLHSQHCCTNIIMYITLWLMLCRIYFVYYNKSNAIWQANSMSITTLLMLYKTYIVYYSFPTTIQQGLCLLHTII